MLCRSCCFEFLRLQATIREKHPTLARPSAYLWKLHEAAVATATTLEVVIVKPNVSNKRG